MIVDIVEACFKVGAKIYDLHRECKTNKNQCKKLVSRIEIILGSLKVLNALPETEAFKSALEKLKEVLSACEMFIEKFSSSKTWYKKVMLGGTYSKEFSALNKELESSVELLNLGLNIQSIFNQQQDKEAAQIDQDQILAHYEEILRLNHESLREEIQHLQVGQAEQNELLKKQLLSMEAAFKAICGAVQKPQEIDPKIMGSFHHIFFEKKIGDFSTGAIYKARYFAQDVAVKVMHIASEEARASFIYEIKVTSPLRHANIVPFVAACVDSSEQACLIMQYFQNQDLSSWLLRRTELTEREKNRIAHQLASGLVYLHGNNVVHGNIQPSNVLIDAYGNACWNDFGFSKTKSASLQSLKKTVQESKWQAPEAYKRGAVLTHKSDIFSFGLLLYFLFSTKEPTGNFSEDLSLLSNEKHRAIVSACCIDDPLIRTDAKFLEAEFSKIELSFNRSNSPTGEEYFNRAIFFHKNKDWTNAEKNYQHAARKNVLGASANLGSLFLTQNKKTEAFHAMKIDAEKGHVRAMYNLAMMYEKGDGVSQNLIEAEKWYQKVVGVADFDREKSGVSDESDVLNLKRKAADKCKMLNDSKMKAKSYQ